MSNCPAMSNCLAMSNNLTMNDNLVLQCPTCKKPVHWNEKFPHRPFCSERCQKIDFGDWASENHRITSNEGSETEAGAESGSDDEW